ncbi:methionine synthase [Geitlerinema sp. P-1104]|uniref:Npun_R2821/Npun_R2822 family protein n=1 Tax=Geitlerinema sp. P-1104 TaxID=2546230 RepID=UPI00147694F4|nr:Npun_R2821/Npun_R2822 family protein [Geitlerinema sp. P-1104]NMG59461.1 methionine synthase [Geitlerinema sp. P-1104]
MVVQKGLYILANDNLYDQLIALINSIYENYDKNIQICIIPYDDKIKKIKTLTSDKVFFFDNPEFIDVLSNFALDIWSSPRFSGKTKRAWFHCSNTIRKLCAFEGIFDEFIYIDCDSLVMSSLSDCFEKLRQYDCIFNDWEHNKQECFLATDLIAKKYSCDAMKVRQFCHASDFFASRKGSITREILQETKFKLLEDEEIYFLRDKGWWDEVYLFSYLTFYLDWKIFNYTMSSNPRERTGNIAGVDPFIEKDWVLYNAQGCKPIHRIHYMGYKSRNFHYLCQGEDVDIPHRDVFLHYRFLDEPEKAPKSLKKVNSGTQFVRQCGQGVKKLKNRLQPR